ncbi:cobaltochelatase subunit CobN [Aquibium oceanicum]|uniref:Cobaltochelatase subunit CobN n=1 Tax=Aquibium oceanicum TaxID=1670800 RepID=A0A1L3SNQ9_9HYPH|nr:cobaltochelatase subunit CobN [Aquibium oceanicum]APH71057.1 cobaltochelatase subunit CobN [Aquibium oceanicum]
MHILATGTASLDSLIEPIDLAQAPADMVALSFTDSDISGMAAAWNAARDTLPSLRLAHLRDLRHPMSVDLWIEKTAAHARVVLVRLLGGYEWWSYGCEQLAATARRKGIALVLLPGECSERDERLAGLSTVPASDYDALLKCFRDGGLDNLAIALRRLARLAGSGIAEPDTARPVAKAGYYAPGTGLVERGHFERLAETGQPVAPLIFYRSMLLAGDTAPIDALAGALSARGILALPIFVGSLRDREAPALIRDTASRFSARLMLTATAFALGAEPGETTLFDELGLPVFQVAIATTRREAWLEGQRGLAPADLAMHVVLPELDGRVAAGAISFKDVAAPDAVLGVRLQVNRPEPDRVEQVADRIAAFLTLQATPRAERRIMIVVPDYPAATGRAGYAVGLDVPQSVLEMLSDLNAAGYAVEDTPASPRDLMRRIDRSQPTVLIEDYRRLSADLPPEALESVVAAWGAPEDDAPDGHFVFRHARFGNVTVAFAPDRGRSENRRVEYHDPALPPRHALVAFGLWMRKTLGCHALIHVGAHGTLEWLPGKTVALGKNCFPEVVTGSLPVIYPFIVSNPGEAAQAKRRIAAVTIGHLTPVLVGAGLTEDQQALERLVDEYAQADGLDRRRRDRLAALIVETAAKTGLAREAGVDVDTPDEALMKIDAWLCDLKDFAVKDGLHVFGRASEADTDPARIASAGAERQALLDALDGRHLRPGPSGAPSRGRTDVLPTGRNLFAADPRTMPTPTAAELGRKAADEVIRSYLQDHGDYPRSLVIDLWGSASLRTGGEEIAQGLALMGCRPQWDHSTGRVTGIDVLPPAAMGRPRVDVTWRISGLFRDMFPVQIALIDAAVAAIAQRAEEDDDNPLAISARRAEERPARIFGSAPGTYGSGIEEKLASGAWETREELGRAYLDASSHAFGGIEGEGRAAPGRFADRVAGADLLVHSSDDPGRDILEGSADVAFAGGFAAAVAALGGKADVIILDTTSPQRPRARSVVAAVTRTVRARALNRRFIEGQMRHGPRGASEFAETVDRLVGFAETTNAIPPVLIEDVHDAYLGDPRVRAFLLAENPAAARAIAQRFSDARRRGLWHPLRNSVDHDLAALIAEARGLEAA